MNFLPDAGIPSFKYLGWVALCLGIHPEWVSLNNPGYISSKGVSKWTMGHDPRKW
jgi:heterodisulfide reductase subunit B